MIGNTRRMHKRYGFLYLVFRLELHFRLKDDCSVFQEEIFDILNAIEAESYMIFADGQATLRAIASVWCKSRLVLNDLSIIYLVFRLELHFRLKYDCSVLQEEIFGILKTIEAVTSGPTSDS